MEKTLLKSNYSYWFLVPGFFIFFVFFIAPSLSSFYFSLTHWDGITPAKFVGLTNFIELFKDPDNAIGIKNTFIFTGVTTFFKILLGFALALFINMKLKTSMFLRSVVFFPVIISTIAVGLAFQAIYHPTSGMLNHFLSWIHLGFLQQDWITNRKLVMYSICAVEIWRYTGFHMVLFLAGLQTLPKEIYESAIIDGASPWQTLKYITLPLMGPILNVNIILSLIGGFRVFDIVIALTGGGPGFASNVINNMVYKAFTAQRFGEATAANVLLFVIIVVIVLSVQKMLKSTEAEV